MKLPENIKNRPGIYIIRSMLDKRVYVGSSIHLARRLKDHIRSLRRNKHHNSKLQNFYNKYGEESLQFEILELCEPQSLVKREQFHLDAFEAVQTGFNLSPTAGNLLGFKQSPEALRRLSEAMRGRKLTPEHIANMVAAHKPNAGVARIGKKLPEAWCQKMSLGMRSSIFSKRAAMGSRISVVQYRADGQFVHVWHSIGNAATAMGAGVSNFVKAIRNRTIAYGYHWERDDGLGVVMLLRLAASVSDKKVKLEILYEAKAKLERMIREAKADRAMSGPTICLPGGIAV